MTTLWFATPAWRRFETVAICLEQRNRVIDVLAEHGIEGHQVVVADDENLGIARGLGCSVVQRDNEMLGRRFNDGIEYAGRQGADWIVQINSDSWIDPAFFLPLTEPEETLTSEAYCMVTSDRLYELRVSPLDLDQAADRTSSTAACSSRAASDHRMRRDDHDRHLDRRRDPPPSLADYLRDRPNEWVVGRDLARIGGAYAWRTRVSEARRFHGMVIENRVRLVARPGDLAPLESQRIPLRPGEAVLAMAIDLEHDLEHARDIFSRRAWLRERITEDEWADLKARKWDSLVANRERLVWIVGFSYGYCAARRCNICYREFMEERRERGERACISGT